MNQGSTCKDGKVSAGQSMDYLADEQSALAHAESIYRSLLVHWKRRHRTQKTTRQKEPGKVKARRRIWLRAGG